MTSEAKALHVFDDDVDKVVAYSPDDAWLVWCAETGSDPEEDGAARFFQMPDDETIFIWCIDGKPCEHGELGGAPIKLTCREWADRVGRGFLCSSEY